MAACRFIKVPVLLVIVGSILSNFIRLQLRLRRIDAGRYEIEFDAAILNSTIDLVSAASSALDNIGIINIGSFDHGKSTTTPSDMRILEDEYERQLNASLRPMANATTGANYYKFYSGLCNEYEMFIGYAVMVVHEEQKLDQILVEPLVWKDLFGTGEYVPHTLLWDVVHWNSYYPRLPRMVSYHQSASDQEAKEVFPDIYFDKTTGYMNWAVDDPQQNATRPFAVGRAPRNYLNAFFQYTKRVMLRHEGHPFESEKLVAQGALRPHPVIRRMIEDYLEQFQKKQKQTQVDEHVGRYAVLHARIEPDMIDHPVCQDRKVVFFSDIMDGIHRNITTPSFTDLILFFNREMLEDVAIEGRSNKLTGRSAKLGAKAQEVAEKNLKSINRAIDEGMWNGRVRVHEAGSEFAKTYNHSVYSKYSVLTGQIINLNLAFDSEVFIGTELSSYSGVVISSRFYREKRQNYFYRPEGLVEATPTVAEVPPRFHCSF